MASSIPEFPKFQIHGEETSAGVRWRKYIARFENLVGGMGIVDEHARKKCLLLHLAGEEVFDIVQTFTDAQKGDDTDDGYKTLKKSLTDYFEPKKSLDYETFKFRQEKQKVDESVDSFCTRLRQLGSTCEFADLDREIKAQVLQGCSSNRLRRRALREDIDLAGLVKLARSLELADIQAKEMETAETANFVKQGKGFNATSHRSKQTAHRPSHGQKRQTGDDKENCGWCGSNNRHAKKDCPARDKSCRNCGKLGHWASVCYSNEKPRGKENHNRHHKGRRAMQVQEECTTAQAKELSDEEDYCFGVGKTPKVSVKVNDKEVSFFVDTGSSVNIIDEKTAKELSLKLESTNAKIRAYGATQTLEVAGKVTASIQFKDQCKKQETLFVVRSKPGGNLLSASTAQELGLVQFAFACQANVPDSYPDLFEGIGKLKNTKVKLYIDESVKPVCQPHRRIPFHLRQKVEAELKRLEDLDIIEKVEGPTPWVSPIVAAPKPKNPEQIRICVDMRMPNQAIKRTRHIMPTLDDILIRLNGACVFSKLDLNSGYHQLELDEESRNITTFSTHSGLRRYKRLNFGVTSAAEIFQNHIAEQLADIQNAMNTSDDILVHGRNQQEHDEALIKVLNRMREAGLTLNKDKCQFSRDTIEFYGFVFGKKGVSPDVKKVEAITAMPRPTTQKEVRSFLGMTNYLSRFIPDYADTTKPLRDLTKKSREWNWDSSEENAFQKLKSQISNPKTLAYFNEKASTLLIVDASPVGLGAILAQEDSQGKQSVVALASRALTDVESRYSQTEREALAVVWAVEYFHLYVFGKKFTVISDHKPLEGIFNRPTSKTNARIERWNLRLQSYDFVLKYKPGDNNPADFLSRHPVTPAKVKTTHEAKVADEYVNFLLDHATPKAVTRKEISTATTQDPTLQAVMQALKTGQWNLPKDNSIDNTSFLILKTVRDELSLCDQSDAILRGSRIVIPLSLQQKVVDIAHESHQGLVKTKRLLREKVWFPHIDRIVEDKIKNCLACISTTTEHQREPLRMTPLPSSPWSEVSVDFSGPFSSGDYILVVVDDYSRYPEVEIVSSTSAKSTIPKLHAIFARHGVPDVVKSDNGPPFNSNDFANFASYLGFKHRKVTPLWPQANGGVERMMRTFKKVIQAAHLEGKTWKQELFKALMNYRATPHCTTGISPAQALFNRPIRTRLPESQATPSAADDQIRLNDNERKREMKEYADSRRSATVPDLQVGDNVIVRQPATSKVTTAYRPEPLQITARKGSMITASNSQRTVTRNSSHFKQISKNIKNPRLDIDFDLDTDHVDPGQVTSPPSTPYRAALRSETASLPAAPSSQPAAEPMRRSTRTKKPPLKLQDYAL